MKLKSLKGALGALATAGLLGVSAPAMAADSLIDAKMIPGSFSANVSVVSEYFFRGLSQTDDAPALQGGFDYSVELAKPISLYAGVWGSNVDFNEGGSVDGATLEVDLYGGVNGNIGDTGLSWDLGFIYYTYPGASSDLNYNFWELQGKLGYDFGLAAVTGSVNWSPDFFGGSAGGSGKATYYKLAVDVPLGKVDLSAHVGKQYVAREDIYGVDYTEWGASATINLAGFDLSVAYTDTDITGSPDGKDGMVYFSIGRSF